MKRRLPPQNSPLPGISPRPPHSGEILAAEEVARTKWLVFRKSAIHGTGAFARVPISQGTAVIEYVGQRISKDESLQRCEQNNEYIFALNDAEDLDGNVPWNPARFINHSCAPNCEAELEEERIWIKALRGIAQGEEVTFNYGYDYVDYQDYPCRCGAPECVGYMVAEEFFPEVRKKSQAQRPG
jgi:SET domain-containing protein